jgi:hypothetical protein
LADTGLFGETGDFADTGVFGDTGLFGEIGVCALTGVTGVFADTALTGVIGVLALTGDAAVTIVWPCVSVGCGVAVSVGATAASPFCCGVIETLSTFASPGFEMRLAAATDPVTDTRPKAPVITQMVGTFTAFSLRQWAASAILVRSGTMGPGATRCSYIPHYDWRRLANEEKEMRILSSFLEQFEKSTLISNETYATGAETREKSSSATLRRAIAEVSHWGSSSSRAPAIRVSTTAADRA